MITSPLGAEYDHQEKITSAELEQLVDTGEIRSYEYHQNFPDPGTREECTTQSLIITLPLGTKLMFETYCSGSSENTGIDIGVRRHE